MKKVLLLFPQNSPSNYAGMEYIDFLTRKKGGLLSLTLGTLAALTPPGFDVTIIDENVESVPHSVPFDIVGITGSYDQVNRIKSLADFFSKQGSLVVCGGPALFSDPARFENFADVLIIGEAERTWPAFCRDFLTGNYKKVYKETDKRVPWIDLIPDYSSIPKKIIKKYIGGVVQISRGCPFDCDYCFIPVYMGRKMRYKPIPLIIREVEQLYAIGLGRFIFLADDNFSADRKKAKAILRALGEWNRKKKTPVSFVTQLSIDIARDEEFLRLAVEAGFTKMFVGIETPDLNSLSEAGKWHNTRSDILEDIKTFHYYGIQILGGCMVGFDNDDETIFKRQLNFFMKSGIPDVQAYPLHAVDKTRLKERLCREGRFIENWNEAGMRDAPLNMLTHLTVIPKKMSVEQLQKGLYWLLDELFKPESYAERFGTFLQNFENSPVKKSLNLLKNNITADAFKIF